MKKSEHMQAINRHFPSTRRQVAPLSSRETREHFLNFQRLTNLKSMRRLEVALKVEPEKVQSNCQGLSSLEAILIKAGFCRLSKRPANLVQCRRPKSDLELARILVNRLTWTLLLVEQDELAAGYIQENGRIRPALFNNMVWLPLTARQAELVAWYLLNHCGPHSVQPNGHVDLPQAENLTRSCSTLS